MTPFSHDEREEYLARMCFDIEHMICHLGEIPQITSTTPLPTLRSTMLFLASCIIDNLKISRRAYEAAYRLMCHCRQSNYQFNLTEDLEHVRTLQEAVTMKSEMEAGYISSRAGMIETIGHLYRLNWRYLLRATIFYTQARNHVCPEEDF